MASMAARAVAARSPRRGATEPEPAGPEPAGAEPREPETAEPEPAGAEPPGPEWRELGASEPEDASSSPAVAGAAGGFAARAAEAIWSSRSMSCLTDRTKSPGVRSGDSARTLSSRAPRAQR